MKIVFVETPSPWLVRKHSQITLGPLYLATILKNNGYNVQVLRPESFEDLLGFDVICMSGTTLEYPVNEDCARWLRKNSPRTKILIGGTHATAMYDEIHTTGLFDAICVGEGEALILQMIKDAQSGRLWSIYRNGYIDDLDSIPFPDRSLIKGSHGGDIFAYGKNYIGEGNENIITSRGCPFHCAFCATRSMWDTKIRFRSIDNVIEEINQIMDSSEIRQFRLSDDTITANKKRLKEFCDKTTDLDLVWKASVRADSLISEMCELMANSGCKEVSLGIESGDQRVLDFLNKKTITEKTKERCKNYRDAGITVRAQFMIGTPGEYPDTPEINRDYIEDLDYDMITLATFIPFPGSPIWNDPEAYYCTILDRDFRKYNKDYWIRKNGKEAKREYEPMIHNKFLTIEQMKDNVRRMETYVEDTGKCNKG